MKVTQRLERLEDASTDAEYRRRAEQLAGEWGMPVEQVLRDLLEARDRIERFGLDAELCLLAQESGHSEEKVRADFEAELVKVRDE